MKKKLTLFFVLLVALIGCLTFGACGGDKEKEKENENCTHPAATSSVTQEATCGADGVKTFTCPDCNETWTEKIPATGNHEWQGANCEMQTCKNCTATRAATAEHVWQGADCGDQTCKNCSATRPATEAHNYVPTSQAHPMKDAKPVDANVYCNGDLYTDYECTVCHDKYTSLSKAAQAHTVEEWENGDLERKEGETCIYVGTRTGVCTDCGHTVEMEYEVTGYHRYVTVVTKEATCAVDGEKQTVCADCGEVKENSTVVIAHNENAHIWEKSGAVSGSVQTYKCKNCQHTKTAIVAAQEDAKHVEVTKDALTSANEVVLNGASIAMDETAKKSLPADKNLTLALEVAENADYDASLSEKLEGKDIYDITLNDGEGNITDFGDGKITIRLPYELKDGEDVDAIVIWYVNGDELVPMKATYSNGFVTFTTEHFSYYTVGKYTPEEMCKLYGHNVVTQHQDATCVLNGYHIEVCTRCGDVVKNEAKPALGHKMVDVATECVAATCTTAGRDVKQCSACGYKTDKIVPAKGHTYQETVTAATCTTDGYTAHTCSVCKQSYRDNFVAAKGHVWDIEAPTCTQGQKCTVCGENGPTALGHAYNTNGVCTRCGDGCTHSWNKGNVVPSTCTVKGYTVYTCTICGYSENRDETPLAMHTYEDGVCTQCGAAAPVVYTEYEKILRSLKAEKYTITVDNITVATIVESSYDKITTEIEVTDVEGALHFTKEGEIAIRLTGDMSNHRMRSNSDELYEGSFDIILINSVVYMKLVEDGVERISYIPTDAMLANVPEPIKTVFATVLDPEALKGVLDKVSEQGDTIISLIAQFIDGIFTRTDTTDGYKYTFDNAKVRELNQHLYEDNVSEVIDFYFGEGTFADLRETLLDLLTVKKIPEAIDAIVELAEENNISKDVLFEAVDSIIAMVVEGMQPPAEEPSEQDPSTQGPSAQESTQQPAQEIPTIESIYEDEEMAETTVAQIIEAMTGMEEGQFEQMFENIADMLESTTAYALIEQLSGGGSSSDSGNSPAQPMPTAAAAEEEGGQIEIGRRPTAKLFYDIINAVFADNSITISMLTDKDSAVKSISIDLGIELDILTYDGSTEKESVFGSIQIAVGSAKDVTVPNDYKVNDGIITALKSLVNAAEGKSITLESASSMSFGYSMILSISSDGVLNLTKISRSVRSRESSYDEEGHPVLRLEIYETTYEFGDMSKLQITKSADCGACVMYSFSGTAQSTSRSYWLKRTFNKDGSILSEEKVLEDQEESTDTTTTSCSFYYDYSTGEFFENSQHNYRFDPTQSGSKDDVPCEGTWKEVYVCSKCGDTRVETHTKWHETYTKYSLVDEDGTCLDGIIVEDVCRVCGKTVYSYTNMDVDYHQTTDIYITLKTPHGDMTIRYWGCPCGERADNFEILSNDGCSFDLDSLPGHPEAGEETVVYTSNCAISKDPCEAYVKVELWTEEEGCYTYYYTKYTFFDGDQPIGDPDGYVMRNYWTHHDVTETQISYDKYENGGYRKVTQYHYNCKHEEDYTETEEYRYDEYRRPTYKLSRTEYSDHVDYNEERYVYDGCDYTCYVRYEKDGEEYARDRGTRHVRGDGNHVYATCTQYGYVEYTCQVCGEKWVEWYDYRAPIGHEYEDGHCIYCGLENSRDADGVYTLEDMTNRGDVWSAGLDSQDDLSGDYIVGVWDTRDLSEETTLYFELVYLDGDVEQTLRVALDYDTYYRMYLDEYNSYMIAISGEAVQAAVESAMQDAESGWQEGWEFQGLRVTFLPTGTATQQAVSITLTEAPNADMVG